MWRGDNVNLQFLITDSNVNEQEQQQQHRHVSLAVTDIGTQQALTMVKPTTHKAITTYSQWVSAFAVYAAILIERYPEQAPGLFKHISDIGEMERQFGGTAWKSYDESFRRERKSHQLGFGQIHWALCLRCLEQASHAACHPFRGTNTRGSISRGITHEGHVSPKDNATVSNKSVHATTPPIPSSMRESDVRVNTRHGAVEGNRALHGGVLAQPSPVLPSPIKI